MDASRIENPDPLAGLSADELQATQDLDVWFENIDDERIREAVRNAGGFWIGTRVLPLERIIEGRRATNRPKDSAQLPALEATLAARRAQGPRPD